MEIWQAGIVNSLGAPPPGTTDYRSYYAARIEEQDENFKFFVVEDEEGRILSWLSVMPFRSNPATRNTMGELSVYTHPEHSGKATTVGVKAVFDHADQSELHILLAFIATQNSAAVNLANYFGLDHVATLPPPVKAGHLPPLGLFVYTCRSREARMEVAEEMMHGEVESVELEATDDTGEPAPLNVERH